MGTPQADTRPAQAERICDSLEKYADSTAKEIVVACDANCMSKLFSDLPRMCYYVRKPSRSVTCASGKRTCHLRTHAFLHRPTTQPDLLVNA
jgi:hypothetical protein